MRHPSGVDLVHVQDGLDHRLHAISNATRFHPMRMEPDSAAPATAPRRRRRRLVAENAPLDYHGAHRLTVELGREDLLAARIERERKARGWSQERLAKEMAQAGCPLPQSAISKIERPGPGGRRAITLDEALAFSRVFNTPLPELVVPIDALRRGLGALWRMVDEGAETVKESDLQRSQVRFQVQRLQSLSDETPEVRDWLRSLLQERLAVIAAGRGEGAVDQYPGQGARLAGRDHLVRFLRLVLEEEA